MLLDEIADDPRKAGTLGPAEVKVLWLRGLMALNALVTAMSGPAEVPVASEGKSRLLRPSEASSRFNLPKRWLLARKVELGAVPLTRKKVLFDEGRIERYLERRRATKGKPEDLGKT